MSEYLDLSVGGEAYGHETFAMRHHNLGIMRDDVVSVERTAIGVAEEISNNAISAVREHPVFVAAGIMAATVLVVGFVRRVGQGVINVNAPIPSK